MADQALKVYVPKSNAKARTSPIGEVINISFRVEEALEFFESNKNEKGYINLEIVPRKTKGTYGETHSIILNNWVKPEGGAAPAPATAQTKPAFQKNARPVATAKPAATAPTTSDGTDPDVDF